MDRSVMINLLVELAGLEQEQTDTEARLAGNRSRAKHLEELGEECSEDASTAAEDALRLQARSHNLEQEAAALTRKLGSRRERLAGLADPRQVAAGQAEVDSLQKKLDALEEEALGLMEAAAGKSAAADSLEGDNLRQQDKEQSETARMTAENSRLEAALEEIDQQIARLVGMLPPEFRRHVERLRKGRKPAVVHVQGGACGGCFGQLPPQQGIAAETGKDLVRCPSCARYVVHRPWQ